jgi:broad specificity phosphatase PhoE
VPDPTTPHGGTQAQVVLVRHGETTWAAEGRHTGRTDVPLTGHGRDEAERIGRRLRAYPFARVLVSPLQRARETCRLAGFGAVAEVCPELREWDYGAYEGRTTAEIQAERPGWLLWTNGVPGGETVEQVAQRAERVLAEVRAVPGDVALFAHGHILRILTARWLELPPVEGRRFALDAGGIGILGYEHAGTVVRHWNQTTGQPEAR